MSRLFTTPGLRLAINRTTGRHHPVQVRGFGVAWIILCSSILGCANPQNCQPPPGYPSYPGYPGYPPNYTLPSGTTVPTVGAPNVGAMPAPPMMGQPLPGSVPAYPTMNPGQPIPPGYPTGIPAR
jgi:hypothetical protein